MQTCSPRKLSIVAMFGVESQLAKASKVEKELHNRFSGSRVGGEWFFIRGVDFTAAFNEALCISEANATKAQAARDGKPKRVNTEARARGRPQTGFDKSAYQASYMADLRAAKKIGITIREYRERKRDA